MDATPSAWHCSAEGTAEAPNYYYMSSAVVGLVAFGLSLYDFIRTFCQTKHCNRCLSTFSYS